MSLVDQSLDQSLYEIIVVDNCSTDETKKIVLCADDYGLNQNISEAIALLIQNDRLTEPLVWWLVKIGRAPAHS